MFTRVNELQPYAATGWIEHAKMVEDHGDDESCALLLAKGLKSCRFNETLLIQILKFEERRGNLQNARDIMGRLKDRHVQRTWRVLLEGALVEARAGNVSVARRVFQYVINAPGVRYGPVFLEAARFEERIGEHFHAVRLVIPKIFSHSLKHHISTGTSRGDGSSKSITLRTPMVRSISNA